MGRCLSKNKVESVSEDDRPLSKKEVKEKRKFRRFFQFFKRRSNKVGIAPEEDDPTGSSETSLSDHASLKSNDERVNQELMKLKDQNSTANMFLSNQVRRLPPLGNGNTTSQHKSASEILEELRSSGVIANPKPGLHGCSFEIIDRTATPVLELPRSLSRLEKQNDDETNVEQASAACRLERKLTMAEERRKMFLQRRKEALAARKTIEELNQTLAEKREAMAIENQEKQVAADERRQTNLLQKTKKVNMETVQKKAEELDETVRENAKKNIEKKEQSAENVLMKKDHKQRLTKLANNLHGNAVRRRKQEYEDKIKSDLEREIEHDESYFGEEEKYDL